MFLGNSESSVKKATEQLASPVYRNTTVCACPPVSQFLLVNIGSEAPNLQISLERLPINKRLTWKNAYFPDSVYLPILGVAHTLLQYC